MPFDDERDWLWLARRIALLVDREALDAPEQRHAADEAAEGDVLAVARARAAQGEEELAAVAVRAAVGH